MAVCFRETTMTTDENASSGPATLTPVEARVLGSLVEKEATTPEAYPLTANAVVLACNQKSNRDPMLELEAGEVGHALRELEGRGLVRAVHGARAQRYEHRFASVYSLTQPQQAVLSVMLLRGPQTVAELLTRCERLATLRDPDDTRQLLERLAQRGFLVNLGRAAGQREDRYMHLLGGPVGPDQFVPASRPAGERSGIEARVETLELEIAQLRARLDALAG